jgi:hypothetical protein
MQVMVLAAGIKESVQVIMNSECGSVAWCIQPMVQSQREGTAAAAQV